MRSRQARLGQQQPERIAREILPVLGERELRVAIQPRAIGLGALALRRETLGFGLELRELRPLPVYGELGVAQVLLEHQARVFDGVDQPVGVGAERGLETFKKAHDILLRSPRRSLHEP